MNNGYSEAGSNDIVFVVELCQNCKEHGWNTRHDEAKYLEFFKKLAASIIDRIPNAMIMKNQIPKQYLPFDLYNNLVPNEDGLTPYFQQVPRTGAFEVSYKGMLVFSKLKGGYWPNCELVADKCMMVVQDEMQGKDCSQYLAGSTPMKEGGYGNSVMGAGNTGKKSKSSLKESSPGRKSGMNQQYSNAQPFEVNEMPLRNVKESAAPQAGGDVQVGPHLKTADDLIGFPVFPNGTKSLLCKHLTRDIYNDLTSKKDKFGFDFKNAIFSGCKNVDSGIGVYAGSHDSYKVFAPLMDKIIEDYHGHKKTDNHPAESAKVVLNAPDFPPEEAKMIKSTRIRVGRNLDAFPLGPGLFQDKSRADIESKVTEALSKFDGELKGKYYSLDSLSEKDRKQLIDDHFLFKEGDRFLDACGLNRNWPKNRGIFHNDKKTFLTWVNEEDQLRIISMQPGSNIKEVFQRLCDALAKIEKVAKFAYDPHLGYITSCPTNLGTAMRASVHIHLPNLGNKANKAEFEKIADSFNVQIRGAHGEHTETDDGIFDISNKRRLGITMTSLVQDMYDGVKAMIKREIELAKVANAPAAAGTVKAGPHLKKPEDISGFVVFPAGTTSLVSKYCTKAVYDKYKGKKDKAGVSFEQMILSGSQNIDSGIGCYAGSHDSYTTFSDLFDNVILDYHKHDKKAKHVSNMDYKKLQCPPLSAEDAKMIVSTRIRVGRNLAEFPLGPGITKEQRDKVESTVSGVLKTFTGELAGSYYALNKMSDADRKQLVADHFLFKEGDRFLESCGLNRDWPAGRGIFHNKDKTFLVWINEEDQLRIISMQPGADILAVFTRLSIAAAEIEKKAKFAHDEHLGYITSCPTNLGTALRASVHIKLPFLCKDKKQFNEIADKFYVQIRGIHGEHSESDDGTYDISNKRRLGRSEVDLVQDMYNGIKAMIEAEKKLAAAAGGGNAAAPAGKSVKAGPHLKKPEDITGCVEWPAGTTSLVSKYCTEAVYNKYKGKKDTAGVSFEQMILSGAQNIDSGIGCYAGSHNSYTTFEDLFDKVILDYHQHDKKAKHISNMDYKKLQCPPLSADDAKMIVSTRIRVGRNLAEFPLGPGITKEQRDKVESTVSEVLKTFTGELAGSYYALNKMSDADRKQLVADHFLFKEGDRFLESCGLNRDWPAGRGIFHNKDKTFLVWINEEDQLRIISMQPGADILAVFTRLSIAAAEIEKKAKFAHDEHLGYITSCPTNLGTALRASVHIKLPFLCKDKKQFNEIADKFYVQIRGIHGEHSESDDGTYDISNKRRLGRSEVDLVQDMYNGIKAMIEAEKKLAAVAGGGKASAEVAVKAGPHLKKPEDITGFVEFPADTKSLLSKYLTKDVYNKYKGKKDACGVSFEQMILSGSQNIDSGIGCYAGSHDSYTTFADLFDKVIEDYHKHDKKAKHVSDMDFKTLKCPPFTADEAAMIVSTRIRVGRNLADFPLGPGISKEQRDKVEQLVQTATSKFTGELAGSYYALNKLTEAERKQLIDDHFLFKEGDRFLESCGLNRDWPSGRGIFHNKEKTFLVWVNEEDQLRIISMQKGADILAVFTRLSTAAGLIEKEAKFAHDEHLGYITSCPTNLGTALRASVHIKLPTLGSKANKAAFDKIADQYYVQIRGIHGEHTETDDGVFDISNKRRLGRSEKDLVQDMYDGVKAMIAEEVKLAAAAKK